MHWPGFIGVMEEEIGGHQKPRSEGVHRFPMLRIIVSVQDPLP